MSASPHVTPGTRWTPLGPAPLASDATGLGVQDYGPVAGRATAVAVDPADGTSEVLSTPTHPTPYVYFLRTPGPPEVCEPGTPLTYRNVAVYRIGPGGTFDQTRK